MTTATAAPAPAAPPAAPASATSGGQPTPAAPAQPTTSAQPANGGSGTPAPAITPTPTTPAAPPAAEAKPTESTPTPKPEATAPAPSALELKLPEKTLLPAEAVQAVKDFATTHKLSQEAAQAVLEREHGAVQSYVDTAKQAWAHRMDVEWAQARDADPEIGGAKKAEADSNVQAALARFSTPAFAKIMAESGHLKNPEIIRIFARIGAASREDKFVAPGGGGGSKDDQAHLREMYPSMFKS